MDAINEIEEIKKLYILKSPVNNNINYNHNKYRSDLKINLYKDLDTIVPFLLKSSIIIASYGNLCFEALSYKAPLCIIAQKNFQYNYAKLLDNKKMALSIGIPSFEGLNKVKDSIKSFYLNRDLYPINTEELPSNGLKNIADIIIKEF